MTQPRDGHGQFSARYNEPKHLCSFRLSEFCIIDLELQARMWDCSKTEIIEKFTRGYFKKFDVLMALEDFIEHQRSKYGTNNAQKGEFSTDGSRWYYLNEFKRWIESG